MTVGTLVISVKALPSQLGLGRWKVRLNIVHEDWRISLKGHLKWNDNLVTQYHTLSFDYHVWIKSKVVFNKQYMTMIGDNLRDVKIKK